MKLNLNFLHAKLELFFSGKKEDKDATMPMAEIKEILSLHHEKKHSERFTQVVFLCSLITFALVISETY